MKFGKSLNLEEEENNIIQVTFNVSRDDIKKIGHKAVEEGVSRAEIIRRAIKQYIHNNIEKPQPATKISDRELNRLLRECSPDEESFEIDGEDGFIELFADKGWKLNDLTPEQFDRVLEKLEIGYENYVFPPAVEDWVERFEDLEPTEKQLEEIRAIAEEEEEEE